MKTPLSKRAEKGTILFQMKGKQTFVIGGLGGEKRLRGTVKIDGAKNAALKAMAAAVLFDGEVALENVPETDDVKTLSAILSKLGAKIERDAHSGMVKIDASNIDSTNIDPELAQSMRASVTLTGPLLGRFGKVTFPKPGGCVIGVRPIDLFLEGYKKMGAVVEENGFYDIKVSEKLNGTEIFFNKQTVGGTETLMMAAVLARGRTTLKNCAMEPEIESVAEWLNECGADINGAGTTTIEVDGTDGKLLKSNKPYKTIPDRIEAGSFLILGALCASDLTIENCEPKHLEAVTNLLKDSGVPILRSDISEGDRGSIRIVNNTKPNSSFKAVKDLRTHEYPGLPTDLQAPMTVFLTQATGESVVFETIYEGRFKYVEELQKIGANITVMNPREILIKGPASLKQLPDKEELCAHDIRAGFAVVMAALTGTGKFTVNNIQLIDRGYEKLEEKLRGLGAVVERI